MNLSGSEPQGNPLQAGWWDLAPVGLARVADSGRVTEINQAGASILEVVGDDLTALDGLFEVKQVPNEGASSEYGSISEAERSTSWAIDGRGSRELAYRVRRSHGELLVAFRDVTMRRQQERRAAAVAGTAARVASEHSLATTLNAMAHEVLQANGLAAVQILAEDNADGPLQVVGCAGFPNSDNFFSLLLKCQQRGAELKMLETLYTGKPSVSPHRYEVVMGDTAWEPLHGFLRAPRWDAFASVPILVRDRSVGILNVFLVPGQEADYGMIEFLTTMAEQAALAIDYSGLLERERYGARQAERQRLARDLHDSVVQQVFSIGMQTQALKVLAERGTTVDGASVGSVATELEEITQSTLEDLRSLVSQLRPPLVTGKDLEEVLQLLADNTRRRTGINVILTASAVTPNLHEALRQDVYFIVAEAVHNAVKHSGANSIEVGIDGSRPEALEIEVSDDGCGFPLPADATPAGLIGHGLASMRERAVQWGGQLTVDSQRASAGTSVHVRIPLRGSRLNREPQ